MTGLQATDEVPLDRFGEDFGLLGEFLGVVFPKVGVVGGSLVKGENVVSRLQFRDCYKADLGCVLDTGRGRE